MNVAERRQKLAEIRQELAALSAKLDLQQAILPKKIALLDDVRLGLNLRHAHESSVLRQQHAQRLGFVAEVEAEQLEQALLTAAAEALQER